MTRQEIMTSSKKAVRRVLTGETGVAKIQKHHLSRFKRLKREQEKKEREAALKRA